MDEKQLNYSGDVFHHFYRELCSVTEYPVLIAVDGIEHLTRPTSFNDPYSKKFKGNAFVDVVHQSKHVL